MVVTGTLLVVDETE